MRAITLALTFAAVVAAQSPRSPSRAPDPEVELAVPIAFELQERDLTKAEKAYRDAIASGKLSVEGRQVAHMRLSRMLRTLGREKEADALMEALMREAPVATLDDVTQAPQDIAREAALRAQAEELVKALLRRERVGANESGPSLRFLPQSIAEQLLWIGQPAVPVVIAAIEQQWQATAFQPEHVQGLAGFLWRVGGAKAAQFFTDAAKNASVAQRTMLVATAFQADRPEMQAAAGAFLRDADDAVFDALMAAGARASAPSLQFAPEDIVAACVDGSPARRAWLLRAWGARPIPPGGAQVPLPLVERLVQVARSALQSTDPLLGPAAQAFLASETGQCSVAGIEALLAELPNLAAARRAPAMPLAARVPHGVPWLSKEEALRLLPAVDACAEAMPAGSSTVDSWLDQVQAQVVVQVGADAVPHVLRWLDRGRGRAWLLHGLVDATNRDAVLASFERASPDRVIDYAVPFANFDMPREAFPVLRDRFKAITVPREYEGTVAMAVARTGVAEAAECMVSEPTVVDAMIELGRRCKEPPVRRALLALSAQVRVDDEATSRLLLALLSMRDEQALATVVRFGNRDGRAVAHPYATAKDSPNTTPLRYLVAKNPDPPHGFADAEITGALQEIGGNHVPEYFLPEFWSDGEPSDSALGVIAAFCLVKRPDRTWWVPRVLERIRQDATGKSPLQQWIPTMLGGAPETASRLLGHFATPEIVQHRARLEALLDHDDEKVASAAADALARGEIEVPVDRLIANRHPSIRRRAIGRPGTEDLVRGLLRDPDAATRCDAAARCGAAVDKQAVPALLALLRDDNSNVRSAASDALTRIRFYHEQQAHWDRVLKGLDAGATSAAEKLLLQARPGAPKAQRLLAIKSLGTLGVPEALPFLIDWAAEGDAEVASAAQAAITAIHLDPRR